MTDSRFRPGIKIIHILNIYFLEDIRALEFRKYETSLSLGQKIEKSQ